DADGHIVKGVLPGPKGAVSPRHAQKLPARGGVITHRQGEQAHALVGVARARELKPCGSQFFHRVCPHPAARRLARALETRALASAVASAILRSLIYRPTLSGERSSPSTPAVCALCPAL